jgi:tetratricopeptide (TPR) repeat protein/ADP-heptose:LPS heptosyltransferase
MMLTIAQVLDQAVAHHRAGRFAQAESLYKQILARDPKHIDALQLLGTVACQNGRPEEAIEMLERAIALDGNRSAFHSNLGNAYRAVGRLEDAEKAGRQAVGLQPDFAEGYNNLGVTLQQLNRLRDAAEAFYKATKHKPDYAEAYCNLGLALRMNGDHRRAIPAYLRAIQLRANYGDAHFGMGRSLKELGRLTEAIASYDQAIRSQPTYAEAHNARGATLLGQCRLVEGLASFDEAIRIRADFADAHLNRALALLHLGDLERGWEEYEWRKKAKNAGPRVYTQPEWQGEPLAGKTILVHAEQGMGDTIQFVRYLPLLKDQGARVIFECQAALIPLLKSMQGIDEFMSAGTDPPPFDWQMPIFSLPLRMTTSLQTIPQTTPYLFPEPTRVEYWKQELAGDESFKIGIAWQGNPQLADDKLRSVALKEFAALADMPGVQLYSLQKGPGSEQLAEQSWSCIDLASRLDPPGEAFLDTAAVMAQLDLVITVDTATAHLAGALNVPVWIALMYAADWRWLLDRGDSPWYPSARLFRQPFAGNWGDVFAAMRRALLPLLAERRANLTR